MLSCNEDGIVRRRARRKPGPLPDGKPHFTPKAKSVIWLFMNGGVSHLESFDPKPMLAKYAGKTIPETPFKDVQDPAKLKLARVVVVNDANGQQRNRLLATQIGFKKRGKSGIEVSDWFPHIGECIDDISVVRSMYTTDDNHGAQTQFHSGRHMLDGEYPTLGAWVHYGLGTLNNTITSPIGVALAHAPWGSAGAGGLDGFISSRLALRLCDLSSVAAHQQARSLAVA